MQIVQNSKFLFGNLSETSYLCAHELRPRPMRKTFLWIFLLITAVSTYAHELLSNAEVNAQWFRTTINVKNGGQAPDVVTLLRAFNEAMPTWVVGEVLEQADHPAKGTRQSGTASIWDGKEEDDFRILIDRRNGYVDLESETDVDQMSACVWRKDDGHRIFAISLYEQHVMPQNLLCWYDYDPQTQTMTPAKGPLEEFQPDVKDAEIGWCLPMKGTDFTLTEYYVGLPAITHVYKWDRKQFTFDHTEIPDFEYKLAPDSKGSSRISEGIAWSHYCVLDLTGDGSPVLAFCNFNEGEIGEIMLIAEYKSDHVSLGMATPDGEKLNVFQGPNNRNGSKQVIVVHRDMVGGLWYNVVLGNLVQYVVCDLPNFANPDAGRTVEVTTGFGSKDETTDIIGQLGEWIDLSKLWRWSPITILEGEIEMP